MARIRLPPGERSNKRVIVQNGVANPYRLAVVHHVGWRITGESRTLSTGTEMRFESVNPAGETTSGEGRL